MSENIVDRLLKGIVLAGHVDDDFRATFDEAIITEIGAIARVLLEERHLLYAPPRYLGGVFADWSSWLEPLALQDLAIGLCLEALWPRLSSLRAYAEGGRDPAFLERLLFRYLREQIYKWQKVHDPVGHAVFFNIRCAIELAHGSGLVGLQGLVDHRATSRTICHFVFQVGLTQSQSGTAEQIYACINGSPEFSERIGRIGEKSTRAQQELCAALPRLRDAGITSFKLGSLLEALLHLVRSWKGLSEDGQNAETLGSGLVKLAWQEHPELAAIDLTRLIEQIRGQIASTPTLKAAQRRRILGIFSAVIGTDDDDDEITQAELSHRLEIPRSTLNDDFKRLKEIVQMTIAKQEP